MLPLLKEALEAREPRAKEEKFKKVRETLIALIQNDPAHQKDHERYLLACLEAKGLGLSKPDYASAGIWLSGLESTYKEHAPVFFLHAEDLVRIAEAHVDAAKYILNNPAFLNRICPDYLARIAESNIALASYILGNTTLAPLLDGFDLARIGVASNESAKFILSQETFYQKLDPWGLAWLGETYPDCAKIIFSQEKFTDKLDAAGIIKVATRYKPIGKYVLGNEKLSAKLSSEQLQRLKSIAE